MSLAEMQRDFVAFLRIGNPAVESFVAERSRRGLAVYHHAMRATLTDSLRDVFEKTHAWLGDEGFEAAAAAYIAAHPSSSWTLGDYGGSFTDALAQAYPNDPEIVELAWLDWSLRRAFSGPDAPALDPATLADVDWDIAGLTLAPTLDMRPARTNAAAIWSALAAGQTPPGAKPADIEGVLTVWRQGLSPRFLTVTATERLALDLARAGQSFGEICAHLAEADPHADVATLAGTMLGRWIADGVLVGVGPSGAVA